MQQECSLEQEWTTLLTNMVDKVQHNKVAATCSDKLEKFFDNLQQVEPNSKAIFSSRDLADKNRLFSSVFPDERLDFMFIWSHNLFHYLLIGVSTYYIFRTITACTALTLLMKLFFPLCNTCVWHLQLVQIIQHLLSAEISKKLRTLVEAVQVKVRSSTMCRRYLIRTNLLGVTSKKTARQTRLVTPRNATQFLQLRSQ